MTIETGKKAVLRVLKSIPGASPAAISWRLIGGEFDRDGNAVATNLGVVDPAKLAVAVHIERYLRTLRTSGVEVRHGGPVRYRVKNGGKQSQSGYYPVAGAAPVAVRSGVARATAERVRDDAPRVSSAGIAAAVADLGLDDD